MPRGRAPGYALQREEILARAAELFATRGYPGTSMNEVAEACGISKPALYHYVRDKHGLLVEITHGHVARLQSLVAEVQAERSLAPGERLRRLIEGFVREYAGARHAHRVLTEDVRFLEEAERARVVEAQRKVTGAFAATIAELRPELRAARLTQPLTMLLFGMINWMFTWMRPDGTLDYEQMAPLVADLFFGGLPAVQAPSKRRRAPALARRSLAASSASASSHRHQGDNA